jgi:hypothetical protein
MRCDVLRGIDANSGEYVDHESHSNPVLSRQERGFSESLSLLGGER